MPLNSHYYVVVQFALLVVLLIATVYFSTKYVRTQKKMMEYLKMLESLAETHASLAQQFERNLAEREEIIKGLVKLLDERIEAARELGERLREISESAMNVEKNAMGDISVNPEHEKIVRLARRGLSARRIAQYFQKPLGEIELILGLYGIPTSDNPSD
ncbi:hypothetical protein SAMN05660836_00401 [Thermodesulforhabdus norvegica]|uniref:DUF2802 domain-containing protein n=2 Tax=Thermodesulforhabdus norvegica TaxID=39841 RepID=A0A1I4R5Y5_9BACT|nr:hypothetical protein SAMN05660836_00401 [Thermodesulforhabdus norvegica]